MTPEMAVLLACIGLLLCCLAFCGLVLKLYTEFCKQRMQERRQDDAEQSNHNRGRQ